MKFRMLLYVALALAILLILQSRAHAQNASDLVLKDLIVTQAVYDEPLVLGKATVARVVTSASDKKLYPARVTVNFDGKAFSQDAQVGGNETIVDVPVGAPSQIATMTISAELVPQNADADSANNEKSVTLPVVQTDKKIALFFLPVDWTPEQRSRYNFEQELPGYVQRQAEFFQGAYPVPASQIVSAFTPVPHMLAAWEKQLVDGAGNEDDQGFNILFGSASLAGRRIRPDATLVVAVLPPGWFIKAGYPGPLGLSSSLIKGTVLSLFSPSDEITSAHEAGHIFDFHDDYDHSLNPPRDGILIDRAGYWVAQKQAFSPQDKITTFMSAAGNKQWVDTRIYEYLMARYVIETNGQTSEPIILCATLTNRVASDSNMAPGLVSAGLVRFASDEQVIVSIGAAGMKGGETIEARWFRDGNAVHQESEQTRAGNEWHAFGIYNEKGLRAGKYTVEIYLDGKLVKQDAFEVVQ